MRFSHGTGPLRATRRWNRNRRRSCGWCRRRSRGNTKTTLEVVLQGIHPTVELLDHHRLHLKDELGDLALIAEQADVLERGDRGEGVRSCSIFLRPFSVQFRADCEDASTGVLRAGVGAEGVRVLKVVLSTLVGDIRLCKCSSFFALVNHHVAFGYESARLLNAGERGWSGVCQGAGGSTGGDLGRSPSRRRFQV